MKVRVALCVSLLAGLAPGLARGQAEPAPSSYVPPGGASLETRKELGPRWHLSLSPHFALRINTSEFGRIGYGGGVRLEGALVAIGGARLALGGTFSYDSFSASRLLEFSRTSQAQFALVLIVDQWLLGGRIRPWGSLGPGFTVASYLLQDDKQILDEEVTVLPLLQVAAGFNVNIWDTVDIGLHAEGNAAFPTSQRQQDLFAWGVFVLAADLGFRW